MVLPVLAAVAALTLAGCAGTGESAARVPEQTSSVAPTTVPQAAPNGTALLWPVTDTAAAQQLQAAVDGGSQPWLLDPEEVATSYATQAWGWTDPEPTSSAPGTITLRDPKGTAALTLVQPVRAGSTGIWVVSTAARSPQ